MATRDETRDRNRSSDKKTNRSGGKDRSAFSFDRVEENAVPLLGALAAGAAIGIGANWARKFLQQKSESMMAGGSGTRSWRWSTRRRSPSSTCCSPLTTATRASAPRWSRPFTTR
jgi:hypothetical protein